MINLLKNIVNNETFPIPSSELKDDVVTDTKLDVNSLKNTPFGELIVENIEGILLKFQMNNENEDALVDSTHGSKFIPLGFTRYF